MKYIWREHLNDDIYRIYLRNKNDIQIQLLTYGAIIQAILVRDKYNNVINIVLGFNNWEDYLQANPYIGALLGRVAGRLKGGNIMINDTPYHLNCNEHGNVHLNGGIQGFNSKRALHYELLETQDGIGVLFTFESMHMEEGYPGHVDITYRIFLNHNNVFTCEYWAHTDRTTFINLSHRNYYNLGYNNDFIAHYLQLSALFYGVVDEQLCATGEISRVSEGDDFTHMKRIAHTVLDIPYVLASRVALPHARLYNDETGIQMDIYTNQPLIHVYKLMNYNVSSFSDVYGRKQSSVFSGIALDTQQFPNAYNIAHIPNPILQPYDTYYHRVEHRLSIIR